jgi:hypothetical protein
MYPSSLNQSPTPIAVAIGKTIKKRDKEKELTKDLLLRKVICRHAGNPCLLLLLVLLTRSVQVKNRGRAGIILEKSKKKKESSSQGVHSRSALQKRPKGKKK